jgi:O-methyltransferase
MRAEQRDSAARQADAQAHLAAAREPRAAGPRPAAEELRRAYLDLLKLCLCDLAATSTMSVGAEPDGTVVSRELRGEARQVRSAGMDWPLQGLTMVGLGRLDDLQSCVETVVREAIEGHMIEAGAWRGGAGILMRATLDSLGDGRTVYVADSFQGFPAADERDPDVAGLGAFDFLAVPLEEVRDSFARFGCERGVEFVPGFFEETLSGLAGRRWSLIRLDGDTYGPTRETLRWLYPGLSVGGYLIVDDYGSFEGCREAVEEFRSEHGIEEPLEKVDSTCVRWRRMSHAPIRQGADAPRGDDPVGAPRPVARPRATHVPTAREVELERQLTVLRGRLEAAEAEVARLGSAPWRGPRAWLHQKVHGARR